MINTPNNCTCHLAIPGGRTNTLFTLSLTRLEQDLYLKQEVSNLITVVRNRLLSFSRRTHKSWHCPTRLSSLPFDGWDGVTDLVFNVQTNKKKDYWRSPFWNRQAFCEWEQIIARTMISTENSCADVSAPKALSFTTAVLSLLFAFVTVPGNFLVCLAVFKDPYKRLKTPFTFFVVNLAITDLIVGMVTEPISVVLHFREGLSLPIGDYVAIIHMSYFISCTASVLSLAALTADRFTAISYPLQYRARLTSRRAFMIVGLIWFVSLTLPFVYFKVGYLVYAFVFANSAIALTFVIFLFTYIRVLRGVRRQVLDWERLRESSQTEENRAQLRAAAFEKNITQAFMVMLGLFLCCYTPSCVMIYIMNLCYSCSCFAIHVLRDLQFVFVLCSSALNPFLYAWRLPNFRKAFVRILRWRRVNEVIVPTSGQESGRINKRAVESTWIKVYLLLHSAKAKKGNVVTFLFFANCIWQNFFREKISFFSQWCNSTK